MSSIIRIFDTTLRDGEQSPGASVDVIEAGFAISSPGDFEAIKRIGAEVEGPVICSLARAREGDIKRAWEALRDVPKRRLHTFHSTSDIHLVHQYKIDRAEALRRSVEMVKLAKGLIEDVEFSAMDATRTDPGYLCDIVEAVIEAGAGTVNIPDTVGYTTPEEFGKLIRTVRERVKNIDRAVISVHCHNDLGLAVANSLAAVLNGAGQIECTINGIGERAGNCSMEEIVMALKTRKDFYAADTRVHTEEIIRSSRLVTKITGIPVQPNKAIVGANAFAHYTGIHQDGLLKERTTYEIMRPESIGLVKSQLVLGKHSGRHAFKDKLKQMGIELTDDDLNKAFERFKRIADQKKEVFDEDIEAIISDEVQRIEEIYVLKFLAVES